MVGDSGDDYITAGIGVDHVFAGQGNGIILQKEGFSFESNGSVDLINCEAGFDEVFINTSVDGYQSVNCESCLLDN